MTRRSRWRDERGEISLTQVLMAMTLFIVILGATLSVFEQFVVGEAQTNERNEAQDRARTAVDRIARELRNLASPTPEAAQAIDRADATDVIFQTVDSNGPNAGLNSSNVMRLRYCLDTAVATNAKLWLQTQTWTTQLPPAAPTATACPGGGWSSQQIVAERITNKYDGQNRPLFTANTATLTDISTLHIDLYVDLDPTRLPRETRLSSGVFLRNQNRRPTAVFTATRQSATEIVLNGSLSSDPEGEPLDYQWYDGTTKVGSGITFTYDVDLGSTHSMQLKVFDPAKLDGTAPAQTV